MNTLPFTAEVGAQLLRGLGGGRPFEIIGASGSGQRNGVVFVLTHDYTNPEHKTSLVEVPELHRAVVGVGVTGPPNECKPTVCGPAAAPHSTRPLSRCHVTCTRAALEVESVDSGAAEAAGRDTAAAQGEEDEEEEEGEGEGEEDAQETTCRPASTDHG